jgi:hypothetical protein
LVIRVLRAPSGSSLGSLDGGGGRACEVGGGNHKDPLGLCGFLERVQGEWNDSASPSVSFLDISPAKAGREFRAPSGSSLTQWGRCRACEAEGAERSLSAHPRRTYGVSRLCIRNETSSRRGSRSTRQVLHGARLQPGEGSPRQSTAWLSSLRGSQSDTVQRVTRNHHATAAMYPSGVPSNGGDGHHVQHGELPIVVC